MYGRWLAASFLNILILLILVVGGVVYWIKLQLDAPGPLRQETTFLVESGDHFVKVTQRLADQGIISNAVLFRIHARYAQRDSDLKFANYPVPAGASMVQVLDLITSGAGLSEQVTFPEGFTHFQIVERLNAIEELVGEIATLPLEGYLAPNTYAYTKGDARAKILEQMHKAQQAILAKAWDSRAQGLPYQTIEEVLIAASIIEMETPKKEELSIVSSVIFNRLKQGIPLGMDSTTNYQITGGDPSKLRPIRLSDLQSDSPYNTRRNLGLPPTPVANPSRDAIFAAVQPADTDFLYFVADGKGGHAFAKTLVEHNANKRKWQKIRAQQQ